MLFALSVLHDADDELKESMKTKTLEKPKEHAMDIPKAGDFEKKVTSVSTNFSLFKIESLKQVDKGLVITQSVLHPADSRILEGTGEDHKIAATDSKILRSPLDIEVVDVDDEYQE